MAPATAIAAGRPLLPAAPSALVLPAASPAMAALLPGEPSEAHAGKLTPTYTAWATMMHRQSPQPRFSGLWRNLLWLSETDVAVGCHLVNLTLEEVFVPLKMPFIPFQIISFQDKNDIMSPFGLPLKPERFLTHLRTVNCGRQEAWPIG